MKPVTHLRIPLTLALAAFAVCCSNAFAVVYTITDMGSFTPSDINNNGQVVGSNGTHAVLWSNNVLTDLGTLGGTTSSANAINDSGQIVGVSKTASNVNHAFLYSGGPMQDLSTLGGSSSSATDINNAGQIVGSADTATTSHAFLYSNGNMQDLGALTGTGSGATGINASGQITGVINYSAAPTRHAFFYSTGTMSDFVYTGTLPNSSLGLLMVAINDSGKMIGNIDTFNGAMIGYTSTGSMFPIVGFTSGSGRALDINNLDHIVGSGDTQTGTFAFLDNANLNTLTPGSGWVFRSATAINDAGQIVGYGTSPTGGTHAFLLTPVPEPTSLTLLATGALLLTCRRRKNS